MTVFAICMTAVAAFLLGLNLAGLRRKKLNGKIENLSSKRENPAYLTGEEFINFLNYDGSEQA